jgi:DNA mismatch endonuclease (patch repair protein)
MMGAVRGRDTAPERAVRSALFAAGHRFRLHDRRLPGTPDIVLPRYKTIIFVHGCFWHGHECSRGRRPTSNRAFWDAKLDRNRIRDRSHYVALQADGWRIVTLWECNLSAGTAQLLDDLSIYRNVYLRGSTRELTR